MQNQKPRDNKIPSVGGLPRHGCDAPYRNAYGSLNKLYFYRLYHGSSQKRQSMLAKRPQDVS